MKQPGYKVTLYETGGKGVSLRGSTEFASRKEATRYVESLPRARAIYRNRAERYYTVTVASR